MKTIKYYINKLSSFTNLRTRQINSSTDASAKLTNPRFEINLKAVSKNKKKINSLMSQMYSEENNALFI